MTPNIQEYLSLSSAAISPTPYKTYFGCVLFYSTYLVIAFVHTSILIVRIPATYMYTNAISVNCIMAYIISFDVWCAIFELTPDTSLLSSRWSFRFPFSYIELLSDRCSENSAIAPPLEGYINYSCNQFSKYY